MGRWSQAKGKELQKSGKDKSLEGPNKQERPEEAHLELSQGRENQGRPRTERETTVEIPTISLLSTGPLNLIQDRVGPEEHNLSD